MLSPVHAWHAVQVKVYAWHAVQVTYCRNSKTLCTQNVCICFTSMCSPGGTLHVMHVANRLCSPACSVRCLCCVNVMHMVHCNVNEVLEFDSSLCDPACRRVGQASTTPMKSTFTAWTHSQSSQHSACIVFYTLVSIYRTQVEPQLVLQRLLLSWL